MERNVVECKNVHLKVVERTSAKGKKYKVVVAVINGKAVDIGFYNIYTENAFLRAGAKIDN